MPVMGTQGKQKQGGATSVSLGLTEEREGKSMTSSMKPVGVGKASRGPDVLPGIGGMARLVP